MGDLLRVATAGSVDHGKSTLIGRLLHDAKAILADQLADIHADGGPDLAMLTDGLRAEREQGITIDVAYRAFATPHRRFLLADTPGHAEYTRNMVTGASTADVALILLDAEQGTTTQSRRHSAIAALLEVPHVVVCVNKMDRLDWSEEAFDAVVRAFIADAASVGLHDVCFIPISALHGDNVVERSARTDWYAGPALLEHLEALPAATGAAEGPARLPIQLVLEPSDGVPRFAGELPAGVLQVGDEVVALPGGARTSIEALETPDGAVDTATAPLSVAVALADDLGVARGDLLAHAVGAPEGRRELEATICWLGHEPAGPGARYLLKHTSRTVRARLVEVEHRLDLETLERVPTDELTLNDIARVRVRLSEPVLADPYASSRATGAFILIDPVTNDTVAAGMVA